MLEMLYYSSVSDISRGCYSEIDMQDKIAGASYVCYPGEDEGMETCFCDPTINSLCNSVSLTGQGGGHYFQGKDFIMSEHND